MSNISEPQARQIRELAVNGNKIAAIALYRKITGLSLKEAKDAVEAISGGVPATFSIPAQVGELDSFLENRIRHFLAEGKKIEAIKAYREAYHCSLKDAKDAVDLIQVEMRKEGYSNMPSTPLTRNRPSAISNDPFAEEARESRRRIIIFVALLLVIFGALVFFFVLQNGM